MRCKYCGEPIVRYTDSPILGGPSKAWIHPNAVVPLFSCLNSYVHKATPDLFADYVDRLRALLHHGDHHHDHEESKYEK
jgi:hypothetical protein